MLNVEAQAHAAGMSRLIEGLGISGGGRDEADERQAAWDAWNMQHLDVVRAVLTASERVIQREEACTTCNGSGWVTRDPDIGTDRECSVCDGKGRVSDA